MTYDEAIDALTVLQDLYDRTGIQIKSFEKMFLYSFDTLENFITLKFGKGKYYVVYLDDETQAIKEYTLEDLKIERDKKINENIRVNETK